MFVSLWHSISQCDLLMTLGVPFVLRIQESHPGHFLLLRTENSRICIHCSRALWQNKDISVLSCNTDLFLRFCLCLLQFKATTSGNHTCHLTTTGIKMSPFGPQSCTVRIGKKSTQPPTSAVDYLTPEPIKLGIPHPNISKTGQITRHAALDGGFVVFFKFISDESSENHRKIIKQKFQFF